MDRLDWARINVSKKSTILEIGPLWGGFFKKSEGWNVEIIDCESQEKLKTKFASVKDSEKIEKVDYIAVRDYAKATGKEKCYDLIFSSHNIEHVLDLISTLNEYEKMLKDDGVIRLVIPDKRFCCDYFSEVTSLSDVINKHEYMKELKVHTIGAELQRSFNAFFLWNSTYCYNSGLLYADDMEFKFSDNKDFSTYIQNIRNNFTDTEYRDFHEWFYTPASFSKIIYELNVLGYINLMVSECIEVHDRVEFYIELKKGNIVFDKDEYLELQLRRKTEDFEGNSVYLGLTNAKKANKKIYVYGTGKYSKLYISMLDRLGCGYEAFVVSDGHKNVDEWYGKSVFELSEIKQELAQDAVLVAVSEEFREEIIRNLKEAGINNIIV